jgi:hypothetical protein
VRLVLARRAQAAGSHAETASNAASAGCSIRVRSGLGQEMTGRAGEKLINHKPTKEEVS